MCCLPPLPLLCVGAVLRAYGELAPDYVPKLLHLDEPNRVIVMEMLGGELTPSKRIIDYGIPLNPNPNLSTSPTASSSWRCWAVCS